MFWQWWFSSLFDSSMHLVREDVLDYHFKRKSAKQSVVCKTSIIIEVK